jgi:hypothetical protein
MTITLGSVTVPSADGFRLVMIIGSGAALVALAFAAFLPGRRPIGAVPATHTVAATPVEVAP